VLDPERGKTKTGYLWALARDDRRWGEVDPPAVVYAYATRHGAEHPQRIFDGFNGVLQVDGYAAYKTVGRGRGPDAPLRLAYCWAHGRRKLREVWGGDAFPIAEEGLRRIAELYEIEAEIRGQGADARLAARKARSAPLVATFCVWLDAARARVSAKSYAKSRVGEKLSYFARHWDGLIMFLDDGRIEMDTNPVENAIRTLLNHKDAPFEKRRWYRASNCGSELD
jgi:transposase